MANKKIFSSVKPNRKKIPTYKAPKVILTNTVNAAGGRAYDPGNEHKLAQMISTATFNDTTYTSAEAQTATFVQLCQDVTPLFLAQSAIYASEQGFMKDSPMMALAVLSKRDPVLFEKLFNRLVTYEGNLRTFVQIIRSGVTGRKSLGSLPKRLVNNWLTNRGAERLFRGSIGNDPSLADVIKMTHPNTSDKELRALFAYLVNGKPYTKSNERGYRLKDLPELVQKFEAFKEDQSNDIPEVDFRMLSSFKLTESQWKEVAKNAKWGNLVRNLRNFAQHGVFNDSKLTTKLANTIADTTIIGKVKAMPYQVLQAFDVVTGVSADRFGRAQDINLPTTILEALDLALDATIQNIPDFDCNIIICPDVSGSMSQAVTGKRKGATSTVTAEKSAALITAAIARKNAGKTHIIAFDTTAHPISFNKGDSISKLAGKIYGKYGGGTECSVPIKHALNAGIKADIIYMISDNESWMNGRGGRKGSATAIAWDQFKARNPNARMICHDLVPNGTVQIYDNNNVMNVGGFSDAHFDIVNSFISNKHNENAWITAIKSIVIE